MEQRCHGMMQVWSEPFTRLRLPKFFDDAIAKTSEVQGSS